MQSKSSVWSPHDVYHRIFRLPGMKEKHSVVMARPDYSVPKKPSSKSELDEFLRHLVVVRPCEPISAIGSWG